ncbi:unnamed protein product [Arabidopsis arenosa]|uniref:Transposase MuDR plant domain-containing protein n=1 Tax=Arabidopsis arenosa TaxID=38785 RepID=A0A8S1ZNJ4_ARAAE|nr:unnamed protein product [Arabidopsis arenosa]
MTAQDHVLLVIGEWVKVDSFIWNFEPTTVEGNRFLRLRDSMTYKELASKVKEKLGLRAHDVVIKMSYQYPSWMEIDEGNGSSPQYICEDKDVEVFIRMRRFIEEVNLCVTVVKKITSQEAQPKRREKHWLHYVSPNSDGDSSEDEYDADWHDFALSEHTTSPQEGPIVEGETIRLCSVPTTAGGITIRETEPTIRPAGPACKPGDKGKGVLQEAPNPTEVDSDDEQENQIVLFSQPDIPSRVECSQARVNDTINSSRVAVRSPVSDSESTGSIDGDGNGAEHVPCVMWGRVQEALNKMLLDKSDDPALFCRDAPPVFNDGKGADVETALADINYEGDKLFVGRVFKSKADCKLKIAIHAINRKFHFRTSRSTPKFMVLKCISKTCPWRVYAAKVDASENFQIRQAKLTHTCTVDERRSYHRLATTQVIGEIMQSRFVNIKRGPNAAVIRKFLLDDFHINISYWKAWRAREIAMEKSMGSMAGSYALLPAYIALLQQTNPGSLCFSAHSDDPKDRHSSIYSGLRKVYTDANHAACTVHLLRNVKHLYKLQTLAGLMSAAARAYVVDDFNKNFLQIQKLSPGCAAYLVDIGFSHWTRVHSMGKRYNIIDSNIAESWNSVLKEARDYPLICMLEYIRTTLMDWFAFRRARAARSQTTLAPKVRSLVEANFELAMAMSSLSIPCAHVIAAATSIGMSVDNFVAPAYFEHTLRLSYAEKIYPIPSVGGPDNASGTVGDLNPPFVRRPPGRPKKIRIKSKGEFKRPRQQSNRRCSRCCRPCHNKASCKNAI